MLIHKDQLRTEGTKILIQSDLLQIQICLMLQLALLKKTNWFLNLNICKIWSCKKVNRILKNKDNSHKETILIQELIAKAICIKKMYLKAKRFILN